MPSETRLDCSFIEHMIWRIFCTLNTRNDSVMMNKNNEEELFFGSVPQLLNLLTEIASRHYRMTPDQPEENRNY